MVQNIVHKNLSGSAFLKSTLACWRTLRGEGNFPVMLCGLSECSIVSSHGSNFSESVKYARNRLTYFFNFNIV